MEVENLSELLQRFSVHDLKSEPLLAVLPDEILIRIFQFLDASSLEALGRATAWLRCIVVGEAHKMAVALARQRFIHQAIALCSVCINLDPSFIPALDERAIGRFNICDRVGALEDLRTSMRYSKNKSHKLVIQSVIYELSGQFRKSLECSSKAIEEDSNNSRAYFERAYVLQEIPFSDKSFHEKSISNYEKCLQRGYYRDYVVLYNRGWSKEEVGRLEEALEDYRLTLKSNPYFIQAARSICRIRYLRQDLKGLEEDMEVYSAELQESLERGVSPKVCSHLQVRIGFCLDLLDRDEEALEAYTTALEMGYPRPYMVYNSRAWVCERMHRTEEALADYERSEENNPFFLVALKNKAKLHQRMGKLDLAEQAYERMKKLDPTAAHPFLSLAKMFQGSDPERAIAELDEALEVNCDAEGTEVHLYRAQLCSKERWMDLALESYDKIIEWYPDRCTEVYNLRAHVLIYLGRINEAIASFDECLKICPTDDVALNNMGCLLYCKGMLREAEELFTRRLDTNPRAFGTLCNRAYCYLKTGENEKALIDFTELHRAHPHLRIERMIALVTEFQETDLSAIATWSSLSFKRITSLEEWLDSDALEKLLMASEDLKDLAEHNVEKK